MAMQFHPAPVSESQLSEIKVLEANLGRVLVAMKPATAEYAELSVEELHQVKSMEEKLGVVLVAFDE